MKDLDIKSIVPILEQSDVKFAGLFGSFARDEANEKSDVDILISFKEPKSLIDLVHIQNKLSDILKKKVDLVTERSISPYLKDNIFNDLKIFYGTR